MNAIYKESQARQESQKEVILNILKTVGHNGILNTELTKIMLRFGQIIYTLRLEGYQIKTKNVSRGVVKYILLNPEPQKKPVKKSGIQIIKDELEELDGVFYVYELEEILKNNNLQIIHRPNGLNKAQ